MIRSAHAPRSLDMDCRAAKRADDAINGWLGGGTAQCLHSRCRTRRRFGDEGITAATLLHPWNRELCETEDVICGEDWDELARNLAAHLKSVHDQEVDEEEVAETVASEAYEAMDS